MNGYAIPGARLEGAPSFHDVDRSRGLVGLSPTNPRSLHGNIPIASDGINIEQHHEERDSTLQRNQLEAKNACGASLVDKNSFFQRHPWMAKLVGAIAGILAFVAVFAIGICALIYAPGLEAKVCGALLTVFSFFVGGGVAWAVANELTAGAPLLHKIQSWVDKVKPQTGAHRLDVQFWRDFAKKTVHLFDSSSNDNAANILLKNCSLIESDLKRKNSPELAKFAEFVLVRLEQFQREYPSLTVDQIRKGVELDKVLNQFRQWSRS